jgi:hypothetical protein
VFSSGHRETGHLVFRDITTKTGHLLYVNPHLASPEGARPLFMIPAKENRDLLGKIMEIVTREIKEVDENPIWITITDRMTIKVIDIS